MTVSQTADDGGGSPTTLHRWLRENWEFIAVHNAGRRMLREAAEDRVLGLGRRALEVAAGAIDAGDVKTALTILERMGILELQRPTPGDEDPELVMMRRRNAVEHEKELERIRGLTFAGEAMRFYAAERGN